MSGLSSNRTCFIADRPDEQIDARRIGHHVDLVLVDDDVARIAHAIDGIVLFVLQLGLAD